MHLSLLSDGYVSDSFNDAGSVVSAFRTMPPTPGHFLALCRGLIVLIALSLPVGMTLLARTAPAATDQQDAVQSIAPHGASLRARNG